MRRGQSACALVSSVESSSCHHVILLPMLFIPGTRSRCRRIQLNVNVRPLPTCNHRRADVLLQAEGTRLASEL